MFSDIKEMAGFIAGNGIKMVDIKATDLSGRWRHLTIPAQRIDDGLMRNGVGFDGSSYGFLTVEKSDMVFVPDLQSAFVDPAIETPAISVIGDIYSITDDGLARFASDPRYIAEKAERHLAGAGIADTCLFGPEFEFYVLDGIQYRTQANHIEVHIDSSQASWNSVDSPYDASGRNRGFKVAAHAGYHADQPFDTSFELRNRIACALEGMGIPVKYHHSENGGPGQVEIEVNLAPLRAVADQSQMIKYIVRNIVFQSGRTVTFMPKPFAGECGSGMHVHMQMFKGGRPVFYERGGYSDLSGAALSAICGVLSHAPALLGFTNPSTNSYKRLVPGYEAPVTNCFGTANRSSVIRIPAYARAPDDKRFEFRPPDATANPYLAYAALLMAAVDGINKGLAPGPEYGPYDKNMYSLTDAERKVVRSLPKSLDEAADALELDHAFLTDGGVFPEELVKNQLRAIRADAAEVGMIPHPEEFRRYYDL